MNSKQITDEIIYSLKSRRGILDSIDDDILEEISDEIQMLIENGLSKQEVV